MNERYKVLHIGDDWLVVDFQEPERTMCLCKNYDMADEICRALNSCRYK